VKARLAAAIGAGLAIGLVAVILFNWAPWTGPSERQAGETGLPVVAAPVEPPGTTDSPGQTAAPTPEPPSSRPPVTGSGRARPPVPSPGLPPGQRPLFAHARLDPVLDAAGQPAGLRVLSVLPGGKVARVGIRAGDLLLAINGIRLNDPESFGQAAALCEETFRTNPMVTVTLERDGEVFSLATLGSVRGEPVETESQETPR
jgi:membrane-associated protease RseP (regulator of RpoE activity)